MAIVAPWRPVTELLQPVICTWRVFHEEETVAIRVTLDLRQLATTEDACKAMLETWWRTTWAPLLVHNAQCTVYGVTPLFIGGPNFIFLSSSLRGLNAGTGNIRARSVVITHYAGEVTAEANERHYVPATPLAWQTDGVLKSDTFAALLTAMRGVFLGCDGFRGGLGPSLIIFRPPVVADRLRIGQEAKYAPVEQIVVNSFMDRAPLAP